MASVVEICNRALSNIGNSRSINSLTEASKEAGNVRCTLRPAVMLCFLILTGTLLPNAWHLQIRAIHRLTGNMRISTRQIVCALLKLCFLVYAIQQQQCAFSTKLVQTPTEQES